MHYMQMISCIFHPLYKLINDLIDLKTVEHGRKVVVQKRRIRTIRTIRTKHWKKIR